MAELVVFQLTREEHLELSTGTKVGVVEDRLYLTREGAVAAAMTNRFSPSGDTWRQADADKAEWLSSLMNGYYWRIKARPVLSTSRDDIANAPVDRMGADRPPQSAQEGRTFKQSLISWLAWLLLASWAGFGVMGVLVALGALCAYVGYC